MLVSVLHIIPDSTGKQESVIGADPVLQNRGVTQLYVLIPPFGACTHLTFERIDPGHIK